MRGLIVKHKDGRLSRWNWRTLKNGNIYLDICRYGKDGYYQAFNSTTSEENPQDFQRNIEALKSLESLQVIIS